MDFDILEKDIEQLNKINTKANYTSRDRYNSLYISIYERLLEMEKGGKQILVKVTADFISSSELSIKVNPKKFEFGKYIFKKATYQLI